MFRRSSQRTKVIEKHKASKKINEQRHYVTEGRKEDEHGSKLCGHCASQKIDHTGTIVFQSNVPEPDPLPEEEPKTQEEKE